MWNIVESPLPAKLRSNHSYKLPSYLRKASPFNEFQTDGSLKDVELNVVNLDTERHWHKIGCFSDETLTIDDITWPDKAERPPSVSSIEFRIVEPC